MKDNQETTASGVETLIERLRTQGIAEGQQEARRIVADAEKRAAWIVRQAQEEVEQMRQKAAEEASLYEAAGRQALGIAVRDSILRLKSDLTSLFHDELSRRISHELSSTEMLKNIVLVMAGRIAMDLQGELARFVLPDRIMDLEELRHNPQELEDGVLTEMTRLLAQDLLDEGVEISVGRRKAGIAVQLRDQEIELQFDETTIAELLQMHLQPRFRALLDGIVK